MKKYSTDSIHHGMEENENGEYVKYEDVLKLVLFAINWANDIFVVESFDKKDAEIVIDYFTKQETEK